MDELSSYLLKRYPGQYITGEDDCNLLLWGVVKEGLKHPKLATLNVGVEYDPFCSDRKYVVDALNHKYAADPGFQKLFLFTKQISNYSKLPIAVIAYPALRAEYDGKWENTETVYKPGEVNFFLDKNDGNSGIVSGAKLRDEIYRYLGCTYTDAGTSKYKNKTLADYFHFWSRSFLSKNIVKFDIDGFFKGAEKNVLIEIKRSSIPPIPLWRPQYDKPDYVLQHEFARQIHAEFWLLHHEKGACHDNTEISFFDIGDVDLSMENKDDFLICREVNLQMKLTGRGGLTEKIEGMM